MLYMMDKSMFSCFITSRGLSKSFTTAVYACCRAILYPQSKIIISCATKEQSKNLVKEKIENELWNLSPNLRIEIGDPRKNIKTNINECIVTFKNGSTITAINASQNTRGILF